MTRKIFLDGELATKFGPVFSFTGETVSDALKCIEANRPDFRRYLLDAHEKNIGFSVEVQGAELDCIADFLLPISQGDIILTPIPAGSKSGKAKIATALAILGLLIWNPALVAGGTGIFGGTGAFAGGVGSLNTLGLVALLISGVTEFISNMAKLTPSG